MAWTRAALGLIAAGAVALVLVSGGSEADPRTPAALPGLPPPFLGTAVVGDGGLTAAIDAYGDVVDLRAPGPAGTALIDNPADRQAAGSVAADTGIVPRVSVGGGPALPLWQADSVAQRYLPGSNVVRTVAQFGRVRVEVTSAASGGRLAQIVRVDGAAGTRAAASLAVNTEAGARCEREPGPSQVLLVCDGSASMPGPRGSSRGDGGSTSGTASRPTRGRRPAAPSHSVKSAAVGILRAAVAGDRRWLVRARPLGPAAPAWAQRMYERSLLTLRALTDDRSGAVAAGARDGWAYVWPRDAGTAALAFAAAGYRPEARRIARFLLRLDLGAAARFDATGAPVPGREAQGDTSGWVAVAARAAGLPTPTATLPWRNRSDYREGDPGEYLANAIAASAQANIEPPADGPISAGIGPKSAHRRAVGGIGGAFGTSRGLVRRAGDPDSGLDAAAAWAVQPFAMSALFPAVRRTLLRLAGERTRFGITPGEDWPGVDPWTAPTAWSAWSLAALAGWERHAARPRHRGGESPSGEAARQDRRAALALLADLQRASTPAGALPERVDARTGIPRSTTPLAWSHAFAILTLRELWPS